MAAPSPHDVAPGAGRGPRVRRRPKAPLFQVKLVNEIQVVIVPHTNRVAAKPP